MPQDVQMKSKVCLVGEAAVGKTSLVRRFVINEFDDRYLTTLGARVSKKELQIPVPSRDIVVCMDMTIWDIMGEKGFRELMREAYFHGTKGVLAVCDFSRYSTLAELPDWIEAVYHVVGEVPVVIAVNKVDLKEEVLVLYGDREVEECATTFNAPFVYTSARTGEGVESAFKELAEQIVARQVASPAPPPPGSANAARAA
jgi:small GTP-binding protein